MNENISDYILYKDNQVIIFNKPNGLLVQSGQSKEEKSLKQMAEIYCKHPLGLVHRLDRPVSGVCIFAKNKKSLAHLNQQFQEKKVQKKYHAIIPKGDLKQEGKLEHFIKRNGKRLKAEVSDNAKGGFKKAILNYKIIKEIERYSLLEIDLETGRFHQIRAQMAAVGYPIKDDVKYGAKRGNKNRSIFLHAHSLSFIHPTTNQKINIVADYPDDTLWKLFDE